MLCLDVALEVTKVKSVSPKRSNKTSNKRAPDIAC